MKRLWVRLLLVVASVLIPVLLTGWLVGWERRIRELDQTANTRIGILIVLTTIAAFLAGFYLVRGGEKTEPPPSSK